MFIRLFQRRSSLRVKSLLEQQKSKNQVDEDEENEVVDLTDESKYRLNYSEKFLIKKKEDQESREKYREKVQQDRAVRAQRRLAAKQNLFTKKFI